MRFLPRPVLFWLGLPGFAFLLWAWYGSVTRQTHIILGLEKPSARIFILSSEAGFYLNYSPHDPDWFQLPPT